MCVIEVFNLTIPLYLNIHNYIAENIILGKKYIIGHIEAVVAKGTTVCSGFDSHSKNEKLAIGWQVPSPGYSVMSSQRKPRNLALGHSVSIKSFPIRLKLQISYRAILFLKSSWSSGTRAFYYFTAVDVAN